MVDPLYESELSGWGLGVFLCSPSGSSQSVPQLLGWLGLCSRQRCFCGNGLGQQECFRVMFHAEGVNVRVK